MRLGDNWAGAVRAFADEVRSGAFPTVEHSYEGAAEVEADEAERDG